MTQDISVVIPAYLADDYGNAPRYLRRALQSVFDQEQKLREIIVVFGPARNGFEALMHEYRTSVTFVHEPALGDAPARNVAMRMSSGSLIASLDSDDYWRADKLRLQLLAFEKDPDLDAVFTYAQEFHEPESPTETPQMGDRLEAPIPASMLIKRDAFLRVGYYDEKYRIGAAVKWYIRAQELGLRMLILPDVLLFRRLHSHNQGRRMQAIKNEYLHVLKESLDRRRGR